MPLIDYVKPDEASDAVCERLKTFQETRGRYSSLQLLLANNPHSMLAHGEYANAITNEGDINRELKELAHLTVSLTNDCEYCISSHAQGLVENMDLPREYVDELAHGNYCGLNNRQKAVVEFARQTANDPKRMTSDHIDALREVGFSDGDIVELLVLVSQAMGANAMADAMNVHASDHDQELDTYYPE